MSAKSSKIVKGKMGKPTIIMKNKSTHLLMTDSTSRQ
jgi:hypothetical protein